MKSNTNLFFSFIKLNYFASFHIYVYDLYFIIICIYQLTVVFYCEPKVAPDGCKRKKIKLISKIEYQLANLLSEQRLNYARLSYNVVVAYWILHESRASRTPSRKSRRTRIVSC